LLIISDMSAPCREEERQRGSGLIRVLGRPEQLAGAIKSIAGTLSSLAAALRPCRDINEDMQAGTAGHREPSRIPWPRFMQALHATGAHARAHRADTSRSMRWSIAPRRLSVALPVMVIEGPPPSMSTPIPTRSNSY